MISGNATVENLTIDNFSEDQITISWKYSEPSLACLFEFKVEVKSRTAHRIHSSRSMNFKIKQLNPCTVYDIHVTAMFGGGLPSQQSVGITAHTLPRENLLNEPVQHIQVHNKSDISLTVSWVGPKMGMNCVETYIIDTKDSIGNTVSYEQTNQTIFELINLKKCEVYYVHIRPNYYGTISTASTLQQLGDSVIVTNTTTQDNVVVELRMKAEWNSLQLAWTLPNTYRKCVSEYVVQVCSRLGCLDEVTVHGMSYSVSNLSVCTLYKASVVVKLSESRLSSRNATVTQLTRSSAPLKSQLFYQVKKTSVELQWQVLNMPSECGKTFVFSTLSANGSIIDEKKFDYIRRMYSVLDLKPCQSYSFDLKLVDENGSSTIDYNSVNVVTQASDDMTVSNLEMGRVSHHSLYLKWFLPEESSVCVSNYMVTFRTTDNRTIKNQTPDKNITWSDESPCKLDSVSVHIMSEKQIRGVPAVIDVRQRLEDEKFLSFKVIKIASREVEVLLTSISFICVKEYEVSWYTSGSDVIISPSTKFNRSVSTGHLLPCTEYMAVAQPWNDRFRLQTITRNVTTKYEEPKLTLNISAIPRGFNISWQLKNVESRRCLHYIRISTRSKFSFHEVNVSSSSTVEISNLVPCRTYTITTQVVGIGGKLGKESFESSTVSPQVFPAPGEATILNLTKTMVVLEWKIDMSDSDCRITKFIVNCEPLAGNVNYSHASLITVTITGLQPFTQYKCKGVVVNDAGSSYFSEVTFSTAMDGRIHLLISQHWEYSDLAMTLTSVMPKCSTYIVHVSPQ
ncbi:fibronectin [Homalodisca vitripennis]|nr:fibronectin [Homalodisca vitripennis]